MTKNENPTTKTQPGVVVERKNFGLIFEKTPPRNRWLLEKPKMKFANILKASPTPYVSL